MGVGGGGRGFKLKMSVKHIKGDLEINGVLEKFCKRNKTARWNNRKPDGLE